MHGGLPDKSAGKAMKKIRYIGPYPSVWVPVLGKQVSQGEAIAVPPDVAQSLAEQSDNWQLIRRKAREE